MQGTSCSKCHVVVAPFDPERVQRGLEIFHRGCLRKVQQEEQEAEQQRLLCRIGTQSFVAVH